jgi:hypothetical protein
MVSKNSLMFAPGDLGDSRSIENTILNLLGFFGLFGLDGLDR